MPKFQNKYRIASARASFWEYGWAAAYFVTICTKNRMHFFGEIQHKEMVLAQIGKIAEKEWLKTVDMRPDMNLQMGEFVVMPNHFHGIIIIGENEYNTHPGRDAMHCVSTGGGKTWADTANTPKNKFGPQSKNLASIIRGFKTGVTKNARTINPDFAWQTRYHDHIIRDETSFQNISNYIVNNPAMWATDTFYNQSV